MKKIIITEKQSEYIKNQLLEDKTYIDPKKVLLVKRYLDSAFKRGNINTMGEDGYPTTVKIVGMIGTDGEIVKNMNASQLFYLLQDRFQHLYSNKEDRDKILKRIITDWWEKRIDKNGLLSTNSL